MKNQHSFNSKLENHIVYCFIIDIYYLYIFIFDKQAQRVKGQINGKNSGKTFDNLTETSAGATT